MSAPGFVTTDHNPLDTRNTPQKVSLHNFKIAQPGFRGSGLCLPLTSSVRGTGVWGWARLPGGVEGRKVVVPKLCCKLESLGIENQIEPNQTKTRCGAPTRRPSHFLAPGARPGLREFPKLLRWRRWAARCGESLAQRRDGRRLRNDYLEMQRAVP